MTDLKRLAARLVAGFVTPQEAIKAGEDLLVAGHDDEAIVALASLSLQTGHAEALSQLHFALDSLGVDIPSAEDAAFEVGLEEVRAIARGSRDAIEGARWIWHEVCKKYRFPEFNPFISLADDADAATDAQRAVIALEIVALAKEMTGI